MEHIVSENSRHRLLAILVLAPITLCAIWFGSWPFAIFTGIGTGICLQEWWRLVKERAPVMGMITGVMYLGVFVLCFTAIRYDPVNGLMHTTALMLTVWASDSAAFLAGRAFGGPKMSPRLSPKKTWTGFAGSVVASGAAMFTAFMLFGHLDWMWLALGLFLGAVAQVGDLMISALKRWAGVKDTGTLIPGHGGLLDRIDALLLVTIVFFAFLVINHMWVPPDGG